MFIWAFIRTFELTETHHYSPVVLNTHLACFPCLGGVSNSFWGCQRRQEECLQDSRRPKKKKKITIIFAHPTFRDRKCPLLYLAPSLALSYPFHMGLMFTYFSKPVLKSLPTPAGVSEGEASSQVCKKQLRYSISFWKLKKKKKIPMLIIAPPWKQKMNHFF